MPLRAVAAASALGVAVVLGGIVHQTGYWPQLQEGRAATCGRHSLQGQMLLLLQPQQQRPSEVASRCKL